MLEERITNAVIGSFFQVYNGLGFGFLESNYSRALVVELQSRGFRVRREVLIEVMYRGVSIGQYRLDMIVNDKVLVEVKSTKVMGEADERQLLNYLRASELEVGLLLHFGPTASFRRLVYGNSRKYLWSDSRNPR